MNNTVAPEDKSGNSTAETPIRPNKKRTGLIAVLCVLGALVLATVAVALVILLGVTSAYRQLDQGQYEQAKAQFQKYSFISSLSDMPLECDYSMASDFMEEGEYLKAYYIFQSIPDYKDAVSQSDTAYYSHALDLFDSGEYSSAITVFNELGDYKDCQDMILLSTYNLAGQLFDAGDYEQAGSLFAELYGYKDASDRADQCRINLGIELYKQGRYPEAADTLRKYSEASDEARLCYYLSAFENCKLSGNAFESLQLYRGLSVCSAYSQEAAEALSHPCFYYARLNGAGWKHGRYSLVGDSSNGDTLYFNLPWNDTLGAFLYAVKGDVLELYGDETFWFSINGFSSDEKHPKKMYVTGADGKDYVFERYVVFDQ